MVICKLYVKSCLIVLTVYGNKQIKKKDLCHSAKIISEPEDDCIIEHAKKNPAAEP